MKRLIKPMEKVERGNTLRDLEATIASIIVSNDSCEIIRHVGHANEYLSELAQSRILELERRT